MPSHFSFLHILFAIAASTASFTTSLISSYTSDCCWGLVAFAVARILTSHSLHSLSRCPFLTLTRHLHPNQIVLGLGLQKTSIPYLGEHCIIQRSQISTYLISICASRRPCMIPASIRFPRRLRLIRVVFPNGSGRTQCSMVQLRRTDFQASLQ